MSLIVAALSVFALGSAETPPAPADVALEFKALCLDTGGERGAMERTATARGFAPARRRFEDQHFAEAADPEPVAWSRGEDEAEIRLISAPTRIRDEGLWQDTHQCVVRGEGDEMAVRRALRSLIGADPFPDGDDLVFLWSDGPGGPQSFRQVDYQRRLSQQVRDGARTVRVNKGLLGITLTYMSAR